MATARKFTRTAAPLISVLTAMVLRAGGIEAQPRFEAAPLVPSLPAPQAIEVADFDRDGLMDLVAIDGTNGLVAVQRGDGLGGFPLFSTRSFISPGSPSGYDLTLARLDPGPVPEIVLALGRQGLIHVPVDAAGSLLAPVVITSTLDAFAVAAGDFDGDGNIDLVTHDSMRLAFHAGNGRGGFAEPLFSDVRRPGFRLVPLDINGDGLLDLMTIAPEGFREVRIYPGTGDGSFLDGQSVEIEALGDIAAGDFNGDGRTDVVVSLPLSARVAVLLSDEEGLLGPPVRSPFLPAFPSRIHVADLDADGNLDILTGGFQIGNLTILRGRGDGTFRVRGPFPTGGGAISRVVDANADGWLDIVLTQTQAGAIAVLERTGRGRLRTAIELDPGNDIRRILTADMNGDGRPDMVSLSNDSVAVRLNVGGRQLSPPRRTFLDMQNFLVQASDLDGDGRMDLALLSLTSPGICILPGRGDGRFDEPRILATSSQVSRFEIEDLDRDGMPDILIERSPDVLSVLRGQPDGSFLESDVTTRRLGGPFETGDFNGDGRTDVAYGEYRNRTGTRIDVLLQEPRGRFRRVVTEVEDFVPNLLASGDLDGDGNLDLASTTIDPAVILRIHLGDGQGGFPRELRPQIAGNSSFASLLTEDLDGDGIQDLAASRIGDILVAPGSRDLQTGQPPLAFLAGSPLGNLAAADLDGDGASDLLATQRFLNKVTFLRNRSLLPGIDPWR